MNLKDHERPEQAYERPRLLTWVAAGIVTSVIAALLFAFINPANALQAPPQPPDSRGSTELGFVGSWNLTKLVVDGASVDLPQTLTLKVEGSKISGFAGCNTFGGTITSGDHGAIKVDSYPLTKKLCKADGGTPLENQYLPALRAATYWEGSSTGISFKGGSTYMKFKPASISGNVSPKPPASEDDSASDPSVTPEPPTPTRTGLAGSWDLSKLVVDGASIEFSLPLTLKIDGSSVSGFAGCNRFFGGTITTGAHNTVSISRLSSTRKLCRDGGSELEGKYLPALRSVTTWTSSGMGISLSNGSTTLTFKPQGQQATTPVDESSESELPFAGSWKLNDLKVNGSNVYDGRTPTPTLTVEGSKISGSAGCNRFFGTIEAGSGGAISITNIASTKMACKGGGSDIETQYLSALRSVTAWEGSSSRFSFKGDSVYMTFKPQG